MNKLLLVGLAVIVGALTTTPTASASHAAHTSIDCCQFAEGSFSPGGTTTTFLIGRARSTKHSCEVDRKFIVTFEKASAGIDRHTIGHGFTDSRGVIAWAIPASKEDFDAGAFYRVEVKRSHAGGKTCGAAHGERTGGF